MAVAKLRIDLSVGLIEAEGDESFILQVYADFKDRVSSVQGYKPAPNLHTNGVTSPPTPNLPAAKRKKKSSSAAPADGSKAKKKQRGAPALVKDLDLSGTAAGRLKDFNAKYAAKTNYERNLIFAYFMQEKMGLTSITDDHIFTCYRDIGLKIPKALRQSLLDTAGDRGWIVADAENITVTVHGMNHLEHDLGRSS